jgi:hypothetical protein
MRCGVPANEARERAFRWSPLERWQPAFLVLLITGSILVGDGGGPAAPAGLPAPALGGRELRLLLVAGGMLLFGAALLATRRQVRVRVPYCATHAVLRVWGGFVYYPSLAALVAFAVLAGVARPLGIELPPAVVLAAFACLGLLMALGFILREHAITRSEIRAVEITGDTLVLAGISKGFVEAAQATGRPTT